MAFNGSSHGGLELARVDGVEVMYIDAVSGQQRRELVHELIVCPRHPLHAGLGQHVLKIWVVKPRRRICHKVTVPKMHSKFAVNGAITSRCALCNDRWNASPT